MSSADQKKFRVHVAETRHYEFEVEAANKRDAWEKGRDMWIGFPEVGGYELPDQETDYTVTESAP